jgi:DNA-binding protein H-NS
MKSNQLESMSTDELWNFHQEVGVRLYEMIQSKKERLEKRLTQLGNTEMEHKREPRPYPPVSPKYQNPNNPSETWSGRGKQPRWLSPQLRAGERLDDFLIRRGSGQPKHRRAAR